MLSELTISSLTLPASKEEADKYLLRLNQSYNDTMKLHKECLVKADELIQMLNHLESLYLKKYGS